MMVLRRSIPAILLATAFFALPSFAGEDGPHCTFSVDGVTHIDAPCRVETTYDGSFTVRATDSANGPYGFVLIDGALYEGFWSGNPPALSPHHGLGILTRQDGCWTNARMVLCIAR